jgi:hypothetical protein
MYFALFLSVRQSFVFLVAEYSSQDMVYSKDIIKAKSVTMYLSD